MTTTRRTVIATALAVTLVLGLSVASAQATGPLIVGNNFGAGNGPIQTWDFTFPGTAPMPPIASFIPFGAIPTPSVPMPNGRGVAVLNNEVYYTELTVGLCCATDVIRVTPFNSGAGPIPPMVDSRTLPNPRPGCGIADLAFSGGVLYALVGYPGAVIPGSCPSGLEVWLLNPTSGAPLSAPVPITNLSQPTNQSNSDGFTVLPNGNFLINNSDASCTYNEYSPTTGFVIPITSIVLPGSGCTGVDTDGVSLYFQVGANSFVQTTLAGQFIASRSVVFPNRSEDISLVHVACPPPPFLGFRVLSGATLEDPNTFINGNIHSNNTINFSSQSVVQGDASAVHGFTGKGYTITGTKTPFGPVVLLPTLSQVLLAVPPTSTITGNVSINKANAAAFDNGTFYVKGNVSIGDVTLHSTFIATGTIGMSAGTHLTAFAGGLVAYGDRHVMASGVLNGAVISPDVDLATATQVCP